MVPRGGKLGRGEQYLVAIVRIVRGPGPLMLYNAKFFFSPPPPLVRSATTPISDLVRIIGLPPRSHSA